MHGSFHQIHIQKKLVRNQRTYNLYLGMKWLIYTHILYLCKDRIHVVPTRV